MERLSKELIAKIPKDIKGLKLIVAPITVSAQKMKPGVSFEAYATKNHRRLVGNGNLVCTPRAREDEYGQANIVATEVWTYFTARDIDVNLIGSILR